MDHLQQSSIGRAGAAAVVLALLSILLVPTTAGAQTEVDVTTPAEGWYLPGSITPLIVTIEADGAQSGTVSVQFEGITMVTETFEVAGGSSKRILLSTPTLPWGGGGNLIVDTGDDTIRSNLGLRNSADSELVGVLPSLSNRGLEATAELSVDAGQARLFVLDPTLLDSGAEALGAFTYVVASPSDLDDLGERAAALDEWVSAGGRLVIDAPPGTPIAFDLTATSSASNATFALGLGTVQFTDGAIANGGFDGVLSPTPANSVQNMPFGGFGTMPASPFLAADAGVRVPEIGSIVLFLLAYIALAGPVAYTLIRRSNREPALWLIIPVLALLATAGVWLFGRELRDNVNSAHGTLVVDLPAGQIISTQTMVSAPNGGKVGVDLPDEWRALPPSFDEMMMGMEFGQATNTAAFVEGDELLVDLAPGGVAVVQAETAGPTPADPNWDLDLRVVDDELIGTITNLTAHDLSDVSVSSGQSIQRIGSIDSGETIEVSVGKPGRFVTGEEPLMSRMWQIDWGNNTSAVNPSVISNWLVNNPSTMSADNVLVLGWSREPDGPLNTQNGQDVTDGRTGFLAVSPLVADDGLIGPATNQVRVLRGWENTRVTDPSRARFEEFGVTVQITPTSDPSGQDLVIAVPRWVAAMDVWNGDEWIPAGMVDVVDDVTFAIPPNAFADGAFYARFQLGDEWWGRENVFPTIRSQVPTDEVVALGGAVETEGADND